MWFPRSSLLAFPAGRAPGFNPAHPAGVNLHYQIYPQGISGTNLAAIASVATSFAQAGIIDAYFGPAWSGGPFTGALNFPQPSVTEPQATMAGFFSFTTGGSQNNVISSNGGGWTLTYNASGVLILRGNINGAAAFTGLLNANTPYFVVASLDSVSGQMNCVLVNLATGQMWTSNPGSPGGAGAPPIAPSGPAAFFNPGSSNVARGGCAMWSGTFLSMPQLLTWAADPWAFWYPIRAPRTALVPGTSVAGFIDPGRSTLAYPSGRAPGFDPTHVAVTGTPLLSTIAGGTGFLDLLVGAQRSAPGPGMSIDGNIGPVGNFTGTGVVVDFATLPVSTNVTMAAIIRQVHNSGAEFLNHTDHTTGWVFSTTSSGQLGIVAVGVFTANFGPILVDNVPYFILFSNNAASQFILACRLDTGQVSIATRAGLTPNLGNGMLSIGDAFGNGNIYNMHQAAGAIIAGAISIEAALQWAADPWSFWFPKKTAKQLYVGSLLTPQPAAGFIDPRRPSPAYPAGRAPGFDQTHIAAAKTRLSAIAAPNAATSPNPVDANFINLLKGGIGSGIGATPQGVVFDPLVGPSYQSNGTNTGKSFPGTNVNDVEFTAAFIGNAPTFGGNIIFVANNSNSTSGGWGVGLATGANPWVQEWLGGNNIVSSLTVPSGVPFFCVISHSAAANVANFVWVNLRTGQVHSQTTAGLPSISAPTTNANVVGGLSGWHLNTNWQAAGMWSAQYTPMALLLQWAADPWAFWYPNRAKKLLYVGNTGVIPPGPPTVSLLTRSLAMARGAASMIGKTTIAARGFAMAASRAAFSTGGLLALVASGFAKAAARAAPTNRAALSAISLAAAKGTASPPSGAVKMLARGFARAAARATTSTGSVIALIATSFAKAAARLSPPLGSAGVSALGSAAASARAAPSAAAAMKALGSAMAAGQAAPTGFVRIAARGLATAAGRAILATRQFAFLLAFGFAKATGAAAIRGGAALAAKGSGAAKGSSSLSLPESGAAYAITVLTAAGASTVVSAWSSSTTAQVSRPNGG